MRHQKYVDVARILRKQILKSGHWEFSGSVDSDNLNETHVPNELYSFFRWLITGPRSTTNNEEKTARVDRQAINLAQSTMYACMSTKQVSSTNESVRHSREWPLQVAIGLTVHQSVRSRKLIENQIANEVIRRMYDNGVHIPQEIVRGRYVFFAVDNCDFNEDTPDGKRTLHGTAWQCTSKLEKLIS